MSKAPPVHTSASRELLALIEKRLDIVDQDEAPTEHHVEARVLHRIRTMLLERLPYVEAEAICLVSPGLSIPSAHAMLDLYDEGGDATDGTGMNAS